MGGTYQSDFGGQSMNCIFATAMAAMLALTAHGAPGDYLGQRANEKRTRDLQPNVPSGRLEGDTIASAVPLIVPGVVNGSTTGFADDYDTVCPYSGSVAADVVYCAVSTRDMVATIDLCGSAFDTKIYVWDQALELIACNDDYYSDQTCGLYVSRIDGLVLAAYQPVYIVVDGYGAEHGAYHLVVREADPPCVVEQPLDLLPEGEPPLVEDYEDDFNSGCNGPEFGNPTQTIVYSPSRRGIWGTSGWYEYEGSSVRDTDWFVLAASSGTTIEVVAEQPSDFYELDITDCEAPQILQSRYLEPCQAETLIVQASYTCLWMGPDSFAAPPGAPTEFHYTIRVLPQDQVPATQLGPEGDYSLGCPTVPPGASVWYWDLEDFHNDFVLPAGSCYDGDTTAPDVVFEVWLEAGEWYECVISDPWYPAREDGSRITIPVYLLADCRPLPTSCLAVANYAQHMGALLSYVATETGYYYLVFDSDNQLWNSYARHYKHGDSVPPPPPDHDTCDGARFIGPGPFAFADDLSCARNDFDPGRQGCAGPGGTGRDVVYRVVLMPGETLAVSMTPVGGWDAELYLLSDCDDPAHSCVVAGEPDGNGSLALAYTAAAPGSFFLVCDSYGIGPRPFTLQGANGGTATAVGELGSASLLLTATPNPFNPQTRLRYALAQGGDVSLAVYDLAGRRVASLVDGPANAGVHEVVFDGRDDHRRDLPTGTYLCRFEAAGRVQVTKLMLVR